MWATPFETFRPPTIINAGLSGENTEQMVGRLPSFLSPATKVDVVILLGGTNDICRGVDVHDILLRLTSLHDAVHRAGAVSVALTIPQISFGVPEDKQMEESRLEVNEGLRRYANDHQDVCVFVDLAAAFPQDSTHAGHWESDGVHFTEAGSRAVGEFLADAVRLPTPMRSTSMSRRGTCCRRLAAS